MSLWPIESEREDHARLLAWFESLQVEVRKETVCSLFDSKAHCMATDQ